MPFVVAILPSFSSLECRCHPGSWIVYAALHSPPGIAVAGGGRSYLGGQSDDLLD